VKIRPISCRDVTRLLSRHFWQRFVHRFRSSSWSHFAWLVQKKEITTNSLRWPRAIHQKKQPKIRQVKDSCPSPTKTLKDLSKLKPTKTLKESKDAQRRSIDELFFAKWKRNKTTPRHTTVRIRRSPQQISIVCEKKVGDESEPTTLRGIIVSVEYLKNDRVWKYTRSWKTYATASLLSKDNVRQLNCSRGTCLSEFLNLETRLGFPKFEDDHIRVNR